MAENVYRGMDVEGIRKWFADNGYKVNDDQVKEFIKMNVDGDNAESFVNTFKLSNEDFKAEIEKAKKKIENKLIKESSKYGGDFMRSFYKYNPTTALVNAVGSALGVDLATVQAGMFEAGQELLSYIGVMDKPKSEVRKTIAKMRTVRKLDQETATQLDSNIKSLNAVWRGLDEFGESLSQVAPIIDELYISEAEFGQGMQRFASKYLTDEDGAIMRDEDGNPIENPDYDETFANLVVQSAYHFDEDGLQRFAGGIGSLAGIAVDFFASGKISASATEKMFSGLSRIEKMVRGGKNSKLLKTLDTFAKIAERESYKMSKSPDPIKEYAKIGKFGKFAGDAITRGFKDAFTFALDHVVDYEEGDAGESLRTGFLFGLATAFGGRFFSQFGPREVVSYGQKMAHWLLTSTGSGVAFGLGTGASMVGQGYTPAEIAAHSAEEFAKGFVYSAATGGARLTKDYRKELRRNRRIKKYTKDVNFEGKSMTQIMAEAQDAAKMRTDYLKKAKETLGEDAAEIIKKSREERARKLFDDVEKEDTPKSTVEKLRNVEPKDIVEGLNEKIQSLDDVQAVYGDLVKKADKLSEQGANIIDVEAAHSLVVEAIKEKDTDYLKTLGLTQESIDRLATLAEKIEGNRVKNLDNIEDVEKVVEKLDKEESSEVVAKAIEIASKEDRTDLVNKLEKQAEKIAKQEDKLDESEAKRAIVDAYEKGEVDQEGTVDFTQVKKNTENGFKAIYEELQSMSKDFNNRLAKAMYENIDDVKNTLPKDLNYKEEGNKLLEKHDETLSPKRKETLVKGLEAGGEDAKNAYAYLKTLDISYDHVFFSGISDAMARNFGFESEFETVEKPSGFVKLLNTISENVNSNAEAVDVLNTLKSIAKTSKTVDEFSTRIKTEVPDKYKDVITDSFIQSDGEVDILTNTYKYLQSFRYYADGNVMQRSVARYKGGKLVIEPYQKIDKNQVGTKTSFLSKMFGNKIMLIEYNISGSNKDLLSLNFGELSKGEQVKFYADMMAEGWYPFLMKGSKTNQMFTRLHKSIDEDILNDLDGAIKTYIPKDYNKLNDIFELNEKELGISVDNQKLLALNNHFYMVDIFGKDYSSQLKNIGNAFKRGQLPGAEGLYPADGEITFLEKVSAQDVLDGNKSIKDYLATNNMSRITIEQELFKGKNKDAVDKYLSDEDYREELKVYRNSVPIKVIKSKEYAQFFEMEKPDGISEKDWQKEIDHAFDGMIVLDQKFFDRYSELFGYKDAQILKVFSHAKTGDGSHGTKSTWVRATDAQQKALERENVVMLSSDLNSKYFKSDQNTIDITDTYLLWANHHFDVNEKTGLPRQTLGGITDEDVIDTIVKHTKDEVDEYLKRLDEVDKGIDGLSKFVKEQLKLKDVEEDNIIAQVIQDDFTDADKVVAAYGSNAWAMNIPWIKNYIRSKIIYGIYKRISRPKYNGWNLIIRGSGELAGKIKDDEVYMPREFGNKEVEFRGEKKTISEVFDMYKNGDTSEDVLDALELLVVRTPQENKSGTRVLRLGGFADGGVMFSGKTLRFLGGADVDGDKVKVFHGVESNVKKYFKDAANWTIDGYTEPDEEIAKRTSVVRAVDNLEMTEAEAAKELKMSISEFKEHAAKVRSINDEHSFYDIGSMLNAVNGNLSANSNLARVVGMHESYSMYAHAYNTGEFEPIDNRSTLFSKNVPENARIAFYGDFYLGKDIDDGNMSYRNTKRYTASVDYFSKILQRYDKKNTTIVLSPTRGMSEAIMDAIYQNGYDINVEWVLPNSIESFKKATKKVNGKKVKVASPFIDEYAKNLNINIGKGSGNPYTKRQGTSGVMNYLKGSSTEIWYHANNKPSQFLEADKPVVSMHNYAIQEFTMGRGEKALVMDKEKLDYVFKKYIRTAADAGKYGGMDNWSSVRNQIIREIYDVGDYFTAEAIERNLGVSNSVREYKAAFTAVESHRDFKGQKMSFEGIDAAINNLKRKPVINGNDAVIRQIPYQDFSVLKHVKPEGYYNFWVKRAGKKDRGDAVMHGLTFLYDNDLLDGYRLREKIDDRIDERGIGFLKEIVLAVTKNTAKVPDWVKKKLGIDPKTGYDSYALAVSLYKGRVSAYDLVEGLRNQTEDLIVKDAAKAASDIMWVQLISKLEKKYGIKGYNKMKKNLDKLSAEDKKKIQPIVAIEDNADKLRTKWDKLTEKTGEEFQRGLEKLSIEIRMKEPTDQVDKDYYYFKLIEATKGEIIASEINKRGTSISKLLVSAGIVPTTLTNHLGKLAEAELNKYSRNSKVEIPDYTRTTEELIEMDSTPQPVEGEPKETVSTGKFKAGEVDKDAIERLKSIADRNTSSEEAGKSFEDKLGANYFPVKDFFKSVKSVVSKSKDSDIYLARAIYKFAQKYKDLSSEIRNYGQTSGVVTLEDNLRAATGRYNDTNIWNIEKWSKKEKQDAYDYIFAVEQADKFAKRVAKEGITGSTWKKIYNNLLPIDVLDKLAVTRRLKENGFYQINAIQVLRVKAENTLREVEAQVKSYVDRTTEGMSKDYKAKVEKEFHYNMARMLDGEDNYLGGGPEVDRIKQLLREPNEVFSINGKPHSFIEFLHNVLSDAQQLFADNAMQAIRENVNKGGKFGLMKFLGVSEKTLDEMPNAEIQKRVNNAMQAIERSLRKDVGQFEWYYPYRTYGVGMEEVIMQENALKDLKDIGVLSHSEYAAMVQRVLRSRHAKTRGEESELQKDANVVDDFKRYVESVLVAKERNTLTKALKDYEKDVKEFLESGEKLDTDMIKAIKWMDNYVKDIAFHVFGGNRTGSAVQNSFDTMSNLMFSTLVTLSPKASVRNFTQRFYAAAAGGLGAYNQARDFMKQGELSMGIVKSRHWEDIKREIGLELGGFTMRYSDDTIDQMGSHTIKQQKLITELANYEADIEALTNAYKAGGIKKGDYESAVDGIKKYKDKATKELVGLEKGFSQKALKWSQEIVSQTAQGKIGGKQILPEKLSFQYVERANREVAAAVGYSIAWKREMSKRYLSEEMARKSGGSEYDVRENNKRIEQKAHEAGLKAAREMVALTQFDYHGWNTPKFLRKSWQKNIFQFQSFVVNQARMIEKFRQQAVKHQKTGLYEGGYNPMLVTLAAGGLAILTEKFLNIGGAQQFAQLPFVEEMVNAVRLMFGDEDAFYGYGSYGAVKRVLGPTLSLAADGIIASTDFDALGIDQGLLDYRAKRQWGIAGQLMPYITTGQEMDIRYLWPGMLGRHFQTVNRLLVESIQVALGDRQASDLIMHAINEGIGIRPMYDKKKKKRKF